MPHTTYWNKRRHVFIQIKLSWPAFGLLACEMLVLRGWCSNVGIQKSICKCWSSNVPIPMLITPSVDCCCHTISIDATSCLNMSFLVAGTHRPGQQDQKPYQCSLFNSRKHTTCSTCIRRLLEPVLQSICPLPLPGPDDVPGLA